MCRIIHFRYSLVLDLRVMTFTEKPQKLFNDPAQHALHEQLHQGERNGEKYAQSN